MGIAIHPVLSPRNGQLVQDSGEYLRSTTRSAASCLKRNGIPECCCPVRGEITGLEIGSGQDHPQLGCLRAPSRTAVRRSAGRAGSWCAPGPQELPRSARRVRQGHGAAPDPGSARPKRTADSLRLRDARLVNALRHPNHLGHRGILDPVSAGRIRSRIGAPTGKRPSGAGPEGPTSCAADTRRSGSPSCQEAFHRGIGDPRPEGQGIRSGFRVTPRASCR